MRGISDSDERELAALEEEVQGDLAELYEQLWPASPTPSARFAEAASRFPVPPPGGALQVFARCLIGTRMRQASALLVVIGLLGLVVATTGLPQLPRDSRTTSDPRALPFGESVLNFAGPATSLEQLTGEANLVVVGRVTAIAGVETRAISAGEEAVSTVAYTYLTFRVERYAKGEGPDVITIRHPGDLTTTRGPREFPAPALDEPVLLFLTRAGTSPEVWEVVRGPWGAVHARDDSLYYAWGEEPRIVSFFAGMNLDEAASLVATLAR